MATWILDDGPFGVLAGVVNATEVESWPPDQLFVAEKTASDAEGSSRQALLDANPTPIRTFRVELGTPAADVLFEHLRHPEGSPTANLAEHQSIAWAICDRTDAVLVVVDRRAAILALAELGCGRVAHAHDLWLHLRENGLVGPQQFDALVDATCKKDQSKVPLRCTD